MNENNSKNKLLKSGFWQYNACLNFDSSNYGCINGYVKAAEILTEYITNEMRDQDMLIYPIFFLSRHHIELQLKEIIKKGSYLLDSEIVIKDWGHNLKKCWLRCKDVLLRINQIEPDEYYITIEKVINDLAEIDETGQAFRYKYDKEGNNIIDNQIKHINIKEFFSQIKESSGLLDGAILSINYYTDLKKEIY